MKSVLKFLVLVLFSQVLLLLPATTSAMDYSYELSDTQTWLDDGSETVTYETSVSNTWTHDWRRFWSYYTVLNTDYTSWKNSFWDYVKYHTWSSRYSYVYPFDSLYAKSLDMLRYFGLSYWNSMDLLWYTVNDQRLVLWELRDSSNTTIFHWYIYDILYEKYTKIEYPNASYTRLKDMNNSGQIIWRWYDANRLLIDNFVYDCQNGFSAIDLPDTDSISLEAIDDNGVVHWTYISWTVNWYFSAIPETNSAITCNLVGRDDKIDDMVFGPTLNFERWGDLTVGMSMADYTWDGTIDVLVDHSQPWEALTLLYMWEENFEWVIKYKGETKSEVISNYYSDIVMPNVSDVNGDWFIDKLLINAITGKTTVTFWKGNWEYYYVPQIIDKRIYWFRDFNNDWLNDYIFANWKNYTIVYQVAPVVTDPVVTDPVVTDPVVTDPVVTDPVVTDPVVTDPVVTDPVVTDPVVTDPVVTDPVVTDPVVTDPVVTDPVLYTPGINNAVKIESAWVIKRIVDNKLVLTDGTKLWYWDDTINKYGDASWFAKWQSLEFKAWKKPNGVLVWIKIEVIN